MVVCCKITGTLSQVRQVSGSLAKVGSVSGRVSVYRGDIYAGDYTVTPGEEAVELQTAGKAMENNVTVEPIPSNYGRIAWNGTAIRVY